MWPITSISIIAWILSGKKQKIFLSDHNFLSISCVREMRIPKFLVRFVIWSTYSFATKVIAVSKGVKSDLINLGCLSNNKVDVIYNPAAKGILKSDYIEKKVKALDVGGYDYTIISIGSLEKQKSYTDLINAFSLIYLKLNARLIILGEGSERLKLESLVNELGLNSRVLMPGFIKNPYPWILASDLFVLSSKWEGFGNVIVEALECGIKVVSTNCNSGPAEILDNGRYGHLVPVGDIKALSTAMQKSLLSKHDPQILINRSKDFLIEKISMQYIDLFSRVR
jgi:glycosyltransferase involved in cell wall biosynthesis